MSICVSVSDGIVLSFSRVLYFSILVWQCTDWTHTLTHLYTDLLFLLDNIYTDTHRVTYRKSQWVIMEKVCQVPKLKLRNWDPLHYCYSQFKNCVNVCVCVSVFMGVWGHRHDGWPGSCLHLSDDRKYQYSWIHSVYIYVVFKCHWNSKTPTAFSHQFTYFVLYTTLQCVSVSLCACHLPSSGSIYHLEKCQQRGISSSVMTQNSSSNSVVGEHTLYQHGCSLIG